MRHKIKYTSVLFYFFFAIICTFPTCAFARQYLLCPLNCETARSLYPRSSLAGPDVREVQLQLQKLGFYRGPVHGRFDEATAGAVHRFQKSYGLRPDGIVGPATRHALATAIEELIRPAGAAAGPPPKPITLLIDTHNLTLSVIARGRVYRQYPVALGKPSTPTPVGHWKVVWKATDWGSGFGSRWMGLNVPWGIYGIHGTNNPGSIGSYASHGCIRMFNHDVEELYEWVAHGTPVIITGNPFGATPRPVLREGDCNAAVSEVQRALRKQGFYQGPADGIFGPATEEAVIRFRRVHGLPFDNAVDDKVYELLGL
jgi:peptidoglycan hydrolase-like protein with peptidoglycan-binding domain